MAWTPTLNVDPGGRPFVSSALMLPSTLSWAKIGDHVTILLAWSFSVYSVNARGQLSISGGEESADNHCKYNLHSEQTRVYVSNATELVPIISI